MKKLTYSRREVQRLIGIGFGDASTEKELAHARKALHTYCRETGKVFYSIQPLKFVQDLEWKRLRDDGRPSFLQMVILHFEKMARCFCKPAARGRGPLQCRRCFTISGARRELRQLRVWWKPKVESDAV